MKQDNNCSIANRSMYRNGSTPKIISFSNRDKQRTFDYQYVDSSKMVEITGHSRNHYYQPPKSKEIAQFQHIHRQAQHDSSRTINPENGPETPIKRCRSSVNICFTACNKPSNTLKRRSNNPEVYKTTNIFNEETEANTLTPYRKMTKANDYNKYDTSSQIVGLPGGRKRNVLEINDDSNKPLTKNTYTPCFATKMTKDYKSTVACLPGAAVTTKYNYRKPIFTYKYPSSDIFNANPCIVHNDTVITDSRKRFLNKTNQQTMQIMHQHKCYSLKNISQIQLV